MTQNNACDDIIERVSAERGQVADPRPLNAFASLILLGIALFVAVGVYTAFANLPVVTGCEFYGKCSVAEMAEPPSDLGMSPVE